MANQDFYVEPLFTDPAIKKGFEYGEMTVAQSRKFMQKATLSGYEFIESGFVTIVPNITAFKAARMYNESFDHGSALKGAGETRALGEKGTFNPQTAQRRVHNKYINARKIESERQLQLDEMVATWKRKLFNPSFAQMWKSRGMNAYFINEVFTKPIRKQVANNILYGDYNAARKGVSQFDGALKLLAKATGNQTKHSISYSLPASAADGKFHILAGNKKLVVPFDTDDATTLAAVVTAINVVTYEGSALYAASVVDDNLKVESTEFKRNVELKIVYSATSTIRWSKVAGTTGGDVQIVEEVMAKGDMQPMTIDQINPVTATASQVRDWLFAYARKLVYFTDLEDDVTPITYVSSALNMAIDLAVQSASYDSNGGSGQGLSNIKSMMNIRVHPRLKGGDTFCSYEGNLHAGVDVLSDILSVDLDYNWRDESIDFRMKAAFGCQWLFPQDVITNVTETSHSHFGALDNYADQFANMMQVDNPNG